MVTNVILPMGREWSIYGIERLPAFNTQKKIKKHLVLNSWKGKNLLKIESNNSYKSLYLLILKGAIWYALK